ncbi:PhzF family phenazine biosynthesis protein [Sulfoacidibacillus thermotolerans]|uniref:Phenazine biosynthesis protein PhzF n=1 Tax=Sulfoacidibacillus thermotolerans TaxID=1765684 RepID=A0A2U3DBY4_SULT2|nr:PhzF family phenazine biosynthesis protein [Sulfoacidibacillus thermotolerans]PWI58765.1 hypothetical protein BM613_01330 [Sulfoacidibacillus thermotolerans]
MTDFWIVDVFSVERYSGNQLAVFLHGQNYSTEQMQALAREMHFSETTFIMQSSEQILRQKTVSPIVPVRIFTPAAEIPFAGHPTLGTAFVIQQMILQRTVETLSLQVSAGIIPVQFTYRNGYPQLLTMTQNQPQFGEMVDVSEMARCLGLTSDAFDQQYPIQVVSTGLPFVIVALKHLKDVQKAWVQLEEWHSLSPRLGSDVNILIFTKETLQAENDLHVRVFVPEFGVSEDPATGSANGCLCAFLLKYGLHEPTHGGDLSFTLRSEQGYAIKRPSLLHLQGNLHAGNYQIKIGGAVHFVARAELLGSCQI